jgi:cytochrome c556
MNIKTIFALALTLAATSVIADPISDQIKFRQSAYEFMGWNLKKIKSQVVDHPDTYNKEEVIAAAKAIAATANSGLGSLFTPGSEKGTGWQPTKVKPELFQQPEKAKEYGLALSTESAKLVEVAETGDIAAIKTQFGAVGKTCKTCHDDFRVREKK